MEVAAPGPWAPLQPGWIPRWIATPIQTAARKGNRWHLLLQRAKTPVLSEARRPRRRLAGGRPRAPADRVSEPQSKGFRFAAIFPTRLFTAKLAPQPGASETPPAFYGRRRDPYHLRDLFDGQAAKETELYDTSLLIIHGRQPGERLIERYDIVLPFRAYSIFNFRQIHRKRVATALDSMFRPVVVHQDAAHQIGGQTEEVSTIPPLDSILIDQTEISLVHQRLRLKRLFAFPATQMMAGKALQLAVNQWQQLLQGLLITAEAGQQ